MKYSGAYARVLALHLITVVAVIGPLLVAAPLAARAARAGRVEALRDHTRTTRVYSLASVVVVVLGSALVGLGDVGDQWSYGQAWVGASYLLWLVAVVLLLVVVVPAQTTAAERLDAGEGDVGSLAQRISAAGGVAALSLTAVIVLMVFKPGA